jgi:hypothetical protein
MHRPVGTDGNVGRLLIGLIGRDGVDPHHPDEAHHLRYGDQGPHGPVLRAEWCSAGPPDLQGRPCKAPAQRQAAPRRYRAISAVFTMFPSCTRPVPAFTPIVRLGPTMASSIHGGRYRDVLGERHGTEDQTRVEHCRRGDRRGRLRCDPRDVSSGLSRRFRQLSRFRSVCSHHAGAIGRFDCGRTVVRCGNCSLPEAGAAVTQLVVGLSAAPICRLREPQLRQAQFSRSRYSLWRWIHAQA